LWSGWGEGVKSGGSPAADERSEVTCPPQSERQRGLALRDEIIVKKEKKGKNKIKKKK